MKIHAYDIISSSLDDLNAFCLSKSYASHYNSAVSKTESGDSHLWLGLMEIKDLFLARGRFRVQDGNQTRFWEDLWTGDKPFMVYILLYTILSGRNMFRWQKC